MIYNYSKVPAGTKLYSLRFGEVELVETRKDFVMCRTGQSSRLSWHTDGRYYPNDVTPDLYPSKPEIIAPPMPKLTRITVGWGLFHTVARAMRATYTKEQDARLAHASLLFPAHYQIVSFTFEEEIP